MKVPQDEEGKEKGKAGLLACIEATLASSAIVVYIWRAVYLPKLLSAIGCR